MRILPYFNEAFTNLRHAKLRSMLALLGILVGTASVVAMVLGGQLATNEALHEFKTLGTDLLAVALYQNGDDESTIGKRSSFSLRDALALTSLDEEIREVAPYTQLFYPIIYQGETINGMILGVTNHLANILHIDIRAGRFISIHDRYAQFCVVGQDIYQALKKISLKNPIGETVQIGNNQFQIIGIAKTWKENSFIYANINESIMIPLLSSSAISRYATINNIIMQLSPAADISMVEKHVDAYLKNNMIDKQSNFRSAKELIQKMKNQSNILTVFLGLIGSISLIVGGIGVMNIMLVSIFERKKEIGIRMAMGARKLDIALLFLFESMLLTFVGGLLGVFFGLLIAYVIAYIWHWHFTLFFLAPIVGFSVSVLIGIFFGSYPAYLAAQLNPIDALRSI